MIIGQQISYAIDVINAKLRPLDFGGDQERIERKLRLAQQFSRVLMQIIVSIVVLIFSLILLAKSGSAEVQKASTGFIGTVIGYWLR